MIIEFLDYLFSFLLVLPTCGLGSNVGAVWWITQLRLHVYWGANLQKRKQEKHAFDQESDQEKKQKKKENTLSTKKAIKKIRKNDNGQESNQERKKKTITFKRKKENTLTVKKATN